MMTEKTEYRLNQIFKATLNLTGRVGIAGLKMSDIAKEAKIASGTLYIYFKSKEELLNALYYKLQRESAPAIVDTISHLPINIQLYKMWHIALKSLVEDNLRIIFLEQFLISPLISDTNKKLDIKFKNYLKELLDKGKKENLIKDIDSQMLISLIIGFLRTYSTHLVNEKESILTDDLVDKSFALCWQAIEK
ncbi:TetR/AcrR family transcriptional regulator [Maribacter sp. 2308TA10-17]|uniref:TetR/AcrR family transcriptional regulator n=1 Tax=Maribacter sp. 2308TA10-17 TaxID=3386276 RepID=UPI0039BC2886